MDRATPVVIVGAGIAGLAAALAFSLAGFAVEVFERAERLEEAGAGIQLSPNALRVLQRLGVAESLRDHGVAAESVTLRSYRDGRPIATVPVRSCDGTAYLSIRRADLQAALLAAVSACSSIALTLGADCVGIERAGNRARLDFRRSSGGGAESSTMRRDAAIVIAADGVGSSVARLLGHAPARPSGDVAWRMTIGERPGLPPGLGIEAWLGPSRHAVVYPVRRGLETNIVLIGPRGDGGADLAASADKDVLLSRFGAWDPRLLDLIRAAGPASAWPLSTARRERQSDDPPGLVMIGDAEHAMLPYAAQGAAMAIEDAWVAAIAFAGAATLEQAVARYGAERGPRLRRVRARVAFHRRVYHLPFPLSLGRNLALGMRSSEALGRDLGWLYDWVPPEA